MDFESGEILLIRDFEFPQKSTIKKKDKYMIPLIAVDSSVILVTLPSSQVYISPQNKREGCIDLPEHGIAMYHFPARKVVGGNGFSFGKDTYLYLRQILETTNRKLLEYNSVGQLMRLDQLKDDELKELIYCIYKSDQIHEKYKPLLEVKLDELYDN